MPIPRVAIVGRPNAGKSSLMNMIAGAKVSIVDPTPGVTRDRVTAIVDIPCPTKDGHAKPVEFIDTGGFGVYVKEGERFDEVGADLARLTDSIEHQIQQAVEGADVILFAIDVQAGVTPADEQIARLLRERRFQRKGGKGTKAGGTTGKDAKKIEADAASAAAAATPPAPPQPPAEPTGWGTLAGYQWKKAGSPTPPPEAKPAEAKPAPKPSPVVRVIATKVDGPKWELHAAELSSLGFGEPLLCSARNNYLRRDFLDGVYNLLPAHNPADVARPSADLMLAIVGKRNSGKSSLVNFLAGEPRMIVSEIAGTTRDSVDVRFEFDGKSMVAIDTAGLRRKRSFQNAIEHFAFDRTQRAIDRADAVILLLDATEAISQVDEQLGHILTNTFKPVIVVVNKWDLVDGKLDEKGKKITPETYETYIRRELRGLFFAPISFISANEGWNVRQTINLAFEMKKQSEARVTTGKLNRLVRSIVETRGPTDKYGRFAKVFYVAQTGIAPPTITMVVNHPELFTPNYLRFIMNRFREELPFEEVPMRIVVRARRQREDDLAAEEDGTGQVRITRGRKGMDIRARKRLESISLGKGVVANEGEFDDSILDDAHSQAVEIDLENVSEDADEYFDKDE